MRLSIVSPNLSGDVSILDMGVTMLATYLNERTSHEANIIDFTFHRHRWREVLREKIDSFRPGAVGITMTSLYMPYIRDTARLVKEEYGLPILGGGYHSSLMSDETLEMDDVDAVCIGDGEIATAEYLDTLEGGGSLEGVEGIWAKQNGDIIKNPLRELNQDIDSLPIQNYDLWEDLDEYLYFMELLYFIGTRGCPFNCTYCSEYPMKKLLPGRHFRQRNPEAYAQEIRAQWDKYRDRGMRLAHTFDPVFTVDKKWLEQFCAEYARLGLAGALPYSIFTRADTVDEDKIRMLAETNCRVIRIGIEAGNPRIRNEIYEKHISDEQIREAIALSKKYGLTITGYNMLGGPTETRATLNDTYRLNRELDVHRPVFFIYRPLPKTKAIEKIIESGGIIDHEKMNAIDSLHFGSVILTGDLTPRYVELFQKRMFFYFITRRIFRLIRRQKLRFFVNLARYMFRAWRKKVSFEYTVAYFLICCGDSLTE